MRFERFEDDGRLSHFSYEVAFDHQPLADGESVEIVVIVTSRAEAW